MSRLKKHTILFINLLGIFLLPISLSARIDTTIIIPTPTISANNPVCENATLKLETPFQDGVIFHWYDLNGEEISVVATATVPDMQLSMAGKYTLIAELDGCFSAPASIDIIVTTRPDTPLVSNNGPICEGETLQLDGPTLANTTYKWIDPFGTVISNEEDVAIANMPKELAGDYFLEITQFGCSSHLGGTEVGVIAINETPELTVSGPACEGDSLLIRGPHVAGANYIWTGPNGFQSNNIDSLLFDAVTTDLAGEFTLFLEASGCKSPLGKIAVEVFAKPSAALTGGGNLCEGDSLDLSINLTGTAPFEIVFAIDEMERRPINTSEKTVVLTRSPIEDENYTLVSMTDKNGCPSSVLGTAEIKVFSKPIVELITDTLCDDITENYKIQISVVGGTQPFVYQGVDGVIIDTLFTSELLPTSTLYNFQIADRNNCYSAQITGQYNCPCNTIAGSVSTEPIVVCGEESAEILYLNEEQLDPNDGFIFVLHDSPNNNLGNIIATAESPIFDFSESLDFNQTYYVSPVAGNRTGATINYNDRCLSVGQGTPLTFLPTPPQPDLTGVSSVCPGTALTLNTTPVDGNVIYKWETPIDVIETTTPELRINPVDAAYTGDFSVSVIKEGCSSLPSIAFPVEVAIPSGQAYAGEDTVSCGDYEIYLNANPPAFGFGVWEDVSGAFVEDITNPKSRVSSLQEGPNVFHWVLSTEDCPRYEEDSVIVFFRPNAFANTDLYTLEEEEVTLDFNVLENDITPGGHTIWLEVYREPHHGVLDYLGDGNFSYRRPFINFQGNVAIEYLLCFETPTCPILCDTGSVTIDVMLDPFDPGVFVPDGITPNNDGVNDYLVIEGIENHEKNELLIFDRWGNLVFEASPYKNSWDGTYNNTGLPEGAYYYVLKTSVTDKKTLKGRVYIIR